MKILKCMLLIWLIQNKVNMSWPAKSDFILNLGQGNQLVPFLKFKLSLWYFQLQVCHKEETFHHSSPTGEKYKLQHPWKDCSWKKISTRRKWRKLTHRYPSETGKNYKIALSQLWVWKSSTQNMFKKCSNHAKMPKVAQKRQKSASKTH